MAFDELTLRQQRDLVRIVLCRADAWLDWEEHPIDRPLRSAREILTSIGGLFVPRRVGPGVAGGPPMAPAPDPDARRRMRDRVNSFLLIGAGSASALLALCGTALAQIDAAARRAARRHRRRAAEHGHRRKARPGR